MNFDWVSALVGAAIILVIVAIVFGSKKGALQKWVGKMLNQSEVFRQRFQAESLEESGSIEVIVARPYRDMEKCLLSLVGTFDGIRHEIDRRILTAVTPLALIETAATLASELSGMQIIAPLGAVTVKIEGGYKAEDYASCYSDLDVRYNDRGIEKTRKPRLATPQAQFSWGALGDLFTGLASIGSDGSLAVRITKCPNPRKDWLTTDMKEAFDTSGLKYSLSADTFLITTDKPCNAYKSVIECAEEPIPLAFPDRKAIAAAKKGKGEQPSA